MGSPAVTKQYLDDTGNSIPGPGLPSYAKPGPYITALPAEQEQGFQSWVKQNKIPFDPSPKADYDMRGYYRDNVVGKGGVGTKVSQFDGKPHFPDTYKTPYHKTFSNESRYATQDAPRWQGDKLVGKDGKTVADETPGGAKGKTYLDDDGNPVGSMPPPPPTSGPIAGAGDVPVPPKLQQGPSHQEQNQQNLREGFKGVGKEFAETVNSFDAMSPFQAFKHTDKLIPVNTKASNKEQLAGKVVGAGLEAMAPIKGASADLAKGALGAVGKAATGVAKNTGLPSRKVGAELFKDVMAHAGNVPVSLTRSGDALLRAREIADAGTSMPQAVSKLLRRVTDPSKPTPTYEEMRDFYTNISSLSANEMSRISPVMKRQIGLIAKGLRDDIGDAADQAGQAAKYYAAMKNYSQASKLLRAAHTIGKWAAGAAGAGGLYEGYQLLSKAAGGK